MLLFSSHSSLSPPLSPSPLSPQTDILRAADGRQPTQHVLVVCCLSVVFYFLVACLFFSICVIACNIFFRYIPVFISTYLFIFLFYFLFSYVKDNAYSFVQLSTSFVSPPLTAPFFPPQTFGYEEIVQQGSLMGSDLRAPAGASPNSQRPSRAWHDFTRHTEGDKIQIPKM